MRCGFIIVTQMPHAANLVANSGNTAYEVDVIRCDTLFPVGRDTCWFVARSDSVAVWCILACWFMFGIECSGNTVRWCLQRLVSVKVCVMWWWMSNQYIVDIKYIWLNITLSASQTISGICYIFRCALVQRHEPDVRRSRFVGFSYGSMLVVFTSIF